MKITTINISTLNVPAPPPRNTYYPHNSYVVARIHTDEGIAGLGYTMMVGGNGASAVRAYLQDNLVPLLIGEDPLQIGKLWQKMYDADRGIRTSHPSCRSMCWPRFPTRSCSNGRSVARPSGVKSRCSTRAACASRAGRGTEWSSARRRSRSFSCAKGAGLI